MPLVKLREACDRTGLTPSTLRRRADQGLIAVERTPGGHRLFDIDGYLKAITRTDQLTEFVYEANAGRYRWKEGAGAGQFATKEAILNRTREYIVTEAQALADLAHAEIDLGDFQTQAAQHLKNIHLAQAILGKNGVENLTSEDYLRVGRELKKQYRTGKDDTGRRFGLKWLVEELKDGDLSVPQLRQRLTLFAGSGKVTYWDAWKSDRPQATGLRVLGPGAAHCSFCLAQSQIGPRLIRDIPSPGCCVCFGNCQCHIRELTLEEHLQLTQENVS